MSFPILHCPKVQIIITALPFSVHLEAYRSIQGISREISHLGELKQATYTRKTATFLSALPMMLQTSSIMETWGRIRHPSREFRWETTFCCP